jgi:hypothetical protein
MSKLLRDKATLNFDAARILKESPNYHYCSSIHCSYFSCFQIVKYIVIEICRVDDASIYNSRKTDPLGTKSGHEYLIEFLRRKLVEKEEVKDASMFKNKITELKSLRTNSDYLAVQIDKTISDRAYNLANDIAAILKKVYRYESN